MTRTELHRIEDLAGNLGAFADKNLVSPEETAVLKNASSILWELQMKNEHICTKAEDWIVEARKSYDLALNFLHNYISCCFEEYSEEMRDQSFDAARSALQSVDSDLSLAEEARKGSTEGCIFLRDRTEWLRSRLMAARTKDLAARRA